MFKHLDDSQPEELMEPVKGEKAAFLLATLDCFCACCFAFGVRSGNGLTTNDKLHLYLPVAALFVDYSI